MACGTNFYQFNTTKFRYGQKLYIPRKLNDSHVIGIISTNFYRGDD